MASHISIKVGGTTATLPLNATDAQVAAALRRYARSLGLLTEGTTQAQLTAVLERIRGDIVQHSRQVQLADKRSEVEATVLAEVDADNAL